MGQPKIFWYPEGAASFQTIALPHVSAIAVSQYRDVADAEGLTMTRLDRGGGRLITPRGRYNVANHANVIRALQTLDSYLRYGGRIAYAHDSDKAWMAPLIRFGASGSTSVFTDSNVLPYSTAVTLANNDEIEFMVTNPLRFERAVISTAIAYGTGYHLTLSRGLYNQQPNNGIVRTQYCFPSLYMDARAANSPERWLDDSRHPGLIYEMDLTLVELPYEVASMLGSSLASGNYQIGAGGFSINDTVNATNFEDERFTNETAPNANRVF